MKSTDTTNQMFELLTADDEVKDVYDRQKSIIKLAELVRSMRRKADMTQSELADRIGSKQTVISRLESYDCESMPNIETLILISNACGKQLALSVSSNVSHGMSAETTQPLNESVQVAF